MPFLLFALMAGVLVDRYSRRQLLIVASVLRAPLVLTIPIAAAMDWMTVTQLYVVAFLLGTLTVLSDVAALSIMPSLVPQNLLTQANARLEAARAGSEVVGPGLGGALVQLITAPYALVVDAVSFLVSGAMLSALPRDVGRQENTEGGTRSAWQEIKEGVVFVWRSAVLRWNAAVAGLTNLIVYAFLAIQYLFIIDDLQLGAVFVGVFLSLGGVGGVLGSLAAGWISNRIGIGAASSSAAPRWPPASSWWGRARRNGTRSRPGRRRLPAVRVRHPDLQCRGGDHPAGRHPARSSAAPTPRCASSSGAPSRWDPCSAESPPRPRVRGRSYSSPESPCWSRPSCSRCHRSAACASPRTRTSPQPNPHCRQNAEGDEQWELRLQHRDARCGPSAAGASTLASMVSCASWVPTGRRARRRRGAGRRARPGRVAAREPGNRRQPPAGRRRGALPEVPGRHGGRLRHRGRARW
ncbi:MFS transporter [Micromonospora sp. M12]